MVDTTDSKILDRVKVSACFRTAHSSAPGCVADDGSDVLPVLHGTELGSEGSAVCPVGAFHAESLGQGGLEFGTSLGNGAAPIGVDVVVSVGLDHD